MYAQPFLTALQRFCQTQANGEIEELLGGIRERCGALGVPDPEIVVVDNCCHVRRAIERALPNASTVLDVWHFIMRYVNTVSFFSSRPALMLICVTGTSPPSCRQSNQHIGHELRRKSPPVC